jgi:hypothetical protein
MVFLPFQPIRINGYWVLTKACHDTIFVVSYRAKNFKPIKTRVMKLFF